MAIWTVPRTPDVKEPLSSSRVDGVENEAPFDVEEQRAVTHPGREGVPSTLALVRNCRSVMMATG